MQPRFEISSVHSPDAEEIISDGLKACNKATAGYTDTTPLYVLVRNESGSIVGGLSGKTSYGVLFIDQFHLPENLRKQGLGKQIMALAEKEAIRRGCVSGFLYTLSFLAPEFYKHLGWELFGEIECTPKGTSRFFFKKTL